MNIDTTYDKSVYVGNDRSTQPYDPSNERRIVSNVSGYGHEGSENFEHDDTGSIHNRSGVEDDIFSSYAEHEDWQDGYDY